MNFEIPDWVKYELIDRWRKARSFVNRNPRAVWGITLASGFVLFLVLISILSRPSRPQPQVSKRAYFYDLNTHELFIARADEQGPIVAPSGPMPDGKPAGVRAYVYTYVSDPNENELLVRYLEKPDPNYAKKTDELEQVVSAKLDWGRGKLLRRPDDKEWVPADSSQGIAIVREAAKRDPNGRIPRFYTPK